MRITKRLAAGVAAGLLLVVLGGGTAVAVLNVFGSGSMLQHHVRTENAASNYGGNVYQTFAASSTVVVPGGTSRLITARFTSESQCTGNAGSWCSIRILIRNNSTGALQELFPRSGIDFAFDSVGTDLWESHSVERTIRVGAGSYTVLLQRAVVGTANLRVDDWTFTVDVNV